MSDTIEGIPLNALRLYNIIRWYCQYKDGGRSEVAISFQAGAIKL